MQFGHLILFEFFYNRMSDFRAKMHQIQFRLGLCRRPRCRSLQRSPDVLAQFQGSILKGGEERGGEWEGERERRGKGRE